MKKLKESILRGTLLFLGITTAIFLCANDFLSHSGHEETSAWQSNAGDQDEPLDDTQIGSDQVILSQFIQAPPINPSAEEVDDVPVVVVCTGFLLEVSFDPLLEFCRILFEDYISAQAP